MISKKNVTLRLRTESEFDSAHYLVGYNGPCSRMHGHRWRVIVWVEGKEIDLDSIGMLWDFTNLKEITNKLDHQELNKIFGFNPTAENISIYILKGLSNRNPHLKFKVKVYESPRSSCEVENEDQ